MRIALPYRMSNALLQLPTSVVALTFLIASFASLASLMGQDPRENSDDKILESRLEMAGENRTEWIEAIESAPEEHRIAVKFLIRNMPRKDLTSLTSEFLLEHVRLAYEAKSQAPWSDQVPEEVFFNYVLPYAHVDETREAWRAEMFQICWPIVKDCDTTGEAAQELNKHLFQQIQVKYSTRRKKANQSPSESIEQGLASCTGLSILLADACRSVNVPARLVGIPSWSNKRGNHTWVELWDQEDWHFTGAAEYDSNGLDRAWFMGDAAKADKSKRLNSIYAVSFARTETTFPMVWSADPENAVYAENVTDRYTSTKKSSEIGPDQVLVRIRVWNTDKTERIEAKVTLHSADDDQERPLEGTSPSNTADMNDMLEFALQRETFFDLKISGPELNQTHRFQTTDTETQLLDILLDGKKNNRQD